jgi:hypothetical protein
MSSPVGQLRVKIRRGEGSRIRVSSKAGYLRKRNDSACSADSPLIEWGLITFSVLLCTSITEEKANLNKEEGQIVWVEVDGALICQST